MKSITTNGQDSNIIVGIDIGSSKICCVIGKISKKDTKLKLLGISTVKSAGLKKGSIVNRDLLIEQIDKVMNEAEIMADIKITKAILSITGDHIKSINTQAAIALNRGNGALSTISERPIKLNDTHQVLELAQAISLPMDRDILHTIPQEYIVDTIEQIKNPVGMTGRRLEGRVHLVTAASTPMNNLISCVEELGIEVEGLVFQPFSAGLTTLTDDEKELGVTLVEIGSSTTNIVVYHDNSICHSAVIPIGSSSVTNDIAVMLQISLAEAEKIKIKYASAKSSLSSEKLEINISSKNDKINRKISEQEISRYVEARIQEIFQLVIREISRSDIKDPLTYGIVLTGGGAQMRNIKALAEENLNVKIRIGIPNGIDGISSIAEQPMHTTPLGLLLWPLEAKDYARTRHNSNTGINKFIKSIKDTIEELF